jgi:glucose-6-phosphate 1-epimerase
LIIIFNILRKVMNPRPLMPGCKIVNGMDNNQKIRMVSPDGASAEIYLHGAHLTSWIPSGGSEKIFLSEKSSFGSNASIRGGIPVIFPQFSDLGPLQKHGFARRMEWQPVLTQLSDEDVTTRFNFEENSDTLKAWPHSFNATLSVTLSGQALTVKLRIKNTGTSSFSFTTGLHTYLRVQDIQKVKINGLYHCPYIDTTREDKQQTIQTQRSIQFTGEVDRIYPDAPSDITLVDGDSNLNIASEGFMDTVIWNPWAEKCNSLSDMHPSDYQYMVCIEAAATQKPILLDPQKIWTGSQTISIKK